MREGGKERKLIREGRKGEGGEVERESGRGKG